MNYHESDNRWTIWGIHDFETYCGQAVVEGRFHPSVPKDVREAFVMAEYMMAHAYYHYPLYHEAFSKVLRIIEMGVKLRCQQLGIDLECMNPKRQRKEKKVLKVLMDDLIKAEPAKDLENPFAVARNLRNSEMHPDRHTYSGTMTKSYIKNAINLLNTLFLPPTLFESLDRQLKGIKKELEAYQKGLFVLEMEGGRYLVEGVEAEAAMNMDGEAHYLLVGYPIILNVYENFTQHSYVKPLLVDVSGLQVNAEGIHAIAINSGKEVQVTRSKDTANEDRYQHYLSELDMVSEQDKTMYRHHNSHEVGKKETDFWYDRLWKLNIE
jgi:hypothetical protein